MSFNVPIIESASGDEDGDYLRLVIDEDYQGDEENFSSSSSSKSKKSIRILHEISHASQNVQEVKGVLNNQVFEENFLHRPSENTNITPVSNDSDDSVVLVAELYHMPSSNNQDSVPKTTPSLSASRSCISTSSFSSSSLSFASMLSSFGFRVCTHQLRCDFCLVYLNNKGQLNKHLELVHHIPFICQANECGLGFSTNIDLNLHIRSAHYGRTTWKCTYCLKIYSKRRYLSNHIWRYHEVGVFGCSIDQCTYVVRDTVRNAVQKHLNQVHYRFVCTYPGCAKSLASKQYLDVHMANHYNKFGRVSSTYSLLQINQLETTFNAGYRYLKFDQLQKLALDTGLSLESVEAWFHNQRLKFPSLFSELNDNVKCANVISPPSFLFSPNNSVSPMQQSSVPTLPQPSPIIFSRNVYYNSLHHPHFFIPDNYCIVSEQPLQLVYDSQEKVSSSTVDTKSNTSFYYTIPEDILSDISSDDCGETTKNSLTIQEPLDLSKRT